MTKVVRFADWCDPEKYHGFTPPRRDMSWDDRLNIYLVKAGDFSKIGVAKDVARRVDGLRAGCPFPIEIVSVRTVPTVVAHQAERRIHKRLADHHAHGEWFKIDAVVAKHAINLEISRAKLAMEKWVRGGYHDWRPGITSS